MSIPNMHYLLRYEKIINHYRNNPTEGFVEKHHIIPKCKGGTDDLNNLILLPTRVHFICHYLLHKAYPDDRQLAHAFAMMMVNNPSQNRYTSKLYESAKRARASALKGIPRPEYVKEKLRKPKLNKQNYKKPKSTKHKENISKALKGRKTPWMEKVTNSPGYIEFFTKRRLEKEEKTKFHRENFVKLNLSRKEYYKLFPEINPSTIKRYIKGL